MLKTKKIKSILPLLVIFLVISSLSPALAQNGKALKLDKPVTFEPKEINYNDNITVKITPIMTFNQEGENNGSITIQFELDWNQDITKERIYIINEKKSFDAFIEAAKPNWNVSKKIKEQIRQTFSFSPEGVIEYIPDSKPIAVSKTIDAFKVDLLAFPSDPIKMTANFFSGTWTKMKGFDIEEKAGAMAWEFILPQQYSQSCKEKLAQYQNELGSLDPSSNKDTWSQFKSEEDRTKEDLNKIRTKNEKLEQIIKNLKNDISQGCTDLQNLLTDNEGFLIDKNEFIPYETSLNETEKGKKKEEEVLTVATTSLSESYENIISIYRQLVNLKWEVEKTRVGDEVTLGEIEAKLNTWNASGNEAYNTMKPDVKTSKENILLKRGFDEFSKASSALLENLKTLQQEIKSSGTGEQQATAEKKNKKGWIASHWYLIPSLIIIILAIILVKYWGTIQKALSMKKKVNS